MKISEVRTILSDAVKAPDDIDLKGKYEKAVSEYLKENKSTDDIIPIILEGMDIDRGANYYDFLETAPTRELQKVIKQIRKSAAIKENRNNNSIKFLSGMLSQSFMKVGQLTSQCGNIITFLVAILSSEKKPISIKECGPIVLDYAFDDLDAKVTYPKWQLIETSDKTIKQFSELLLEITNTDSAEKYVKIRAWASQGIKYANDEIKKKQIEAKIPKSRVNELQNIVDHYRTVEKQVRENVYQIDELEGKISELNGEIASLNKDKHDLENKITDLRNSVEEERKRLAETKKELDQQAQLNNAFGALKVNDESALLNDIANDLKAVYQDFKDTEKEKMDVQLGDIYREHIRNIFKILGKKGIRME